MKNVLFLALFLIASISSSAQSEISIVVKNIKAIEGQISVCLVESKDNFLSNCTIGKKAKVTATTETITFENIEPGEYAVTLFHDENGDSRLNTNFLGIPNEPYGFSNNARSFFGPPSHEKCTFQVNGDTTITIKL